MDDVAKIAGIAHLIAAIKRREPRTVFYSVGEILLHKEMQRYRNYIRSQNND